MTDPDEQDLEQRVADLEEAVEELRARLPSKQEGGVSTTDDVDAGPYAPNEKTEAIIQEVLRRFRENEQPRNTIRLAELYAIAEEVHGYTRKQDKKKHARLAVRHGPFKPVPDVTSCWRLDPDALTAGFERASQLSTTDS